MAKARASAARKTSGAARGRGHVSTRATRQTAATKDDIPSVFRDMLSGEGSSHDEGTRPFKKRKFGESKNEEFAPVSHTDEDVAGPESEPQLQLQLQLQTVIDDSESDNSDGMDWEDVDIGDSADYLLKAPDQQERTETLEINVGDSSSAQPTPARARRKAITAAERRSRIQLHKTHLLCLLFNSHIRNAWCNDEKVQASLKRFLNAKLKSLFSPDPNQSQFTAATAFTNGLGLAVETWKKFKFTSVGMRRAKWARDSKDLEFNKIFKNLDSLADVSDLRKAAVAFEGSADTGAMLLCAFLRAAGVETRLVCSLQALPFSAAGQPPPPASDDQKNTVYAEEIITPASPKPTLPKRLFGRRGFGGQMHSRQSNPLAASKKQTALSKPSYPVYWVEAFNSAQQKWIPVDAVATGTVGKPSRLEPPLSDSQVSMSYVLALEDSGVAKDVTRRYAKAYNAKTLKTRIESTPEGARWYRRALKLFQRGDVLDRDQIEDAELAKREAAEEMPKNIQDFKNHPHFVLERHLRHNEVIYPKREVGQVNLGTAARTNLAPIYRRRDVHALKSADKWFRVGRTIKAGEQPLKHGKPRRGTAAADRDDMAAEAEGEDDEAAGVGLYAGFQTEPYVAPPVSPSGCVPRNAFGNLDVYVPSMIPRGGAHVRHPRARQAARLLGIDYADAVTGFKFKGRHGTAVIEGVVVAADNREAVEAVVQGLAEMEAQQERSKRSKEALRLWRKFYRGLAIVRRVQEEYGTAEEKEAWRKEMEEAEKQEELEAPAAGGFLPAISADEPVAEPTAGRFFGQDGDAVGEGSGFLPDSEEPSGSLFDSRIMNHALLRPRGLLGFDGTHDDESVGGGGFIPEDGGGFIPDDEAGGFMPEPAASTNKREVSAEHEDLSLFGDGGGFIPNDDEAGGFIGETEDLPPTGSSVLKGKDKAIEAHDEHLENPSSVPTTENITPADSQSTSTQNEGQATGVEQEDVEAADWPVELNGQSQQAENVEKEGIIGLKDLQDPPVAAKEETLETAAADSESERDSLPSHDPEDEDAEPEWLLSD